MSREKYDEFLVDYAKLIEKHRIFISACGCCGSPWVAEMDNDNPAYANTVEEIIDHLKGEMG